MTDKPQKLEITITPPVGLSKAIRRIVGVSLMMVVPIMLGVYFDSSAMQWLGFLMAFFGLFALAHNNHQNHTFSSCSKAIDYLVKLRDQGEE